MGRHTAVDTHATREREVDILRGTPAPRTRARHRAPAPGWYGSGTVVAPALMDILRERGVRDVEARDPGTVWALNNAHTAEGQAHLADLERRERIRRAHEPKRFIIRKAGPALWAVRDQARPHWVGSRMTQAGAIDMLNVLGRYPHHLGDWDGIVRVTVRVPEEDLDEYDDWDE